jgi:hypothetical protein
MNLPSTLVSAVIDFWCLGVGDPTCDSMVAWMLLSGESREVFRAALSMDDATCARGRGWALSVALIALPYYLDYIYGFTGHCESFPNRAKGPPAFGSPAEPVDGVSGHAEGVREVYDCRYCFLPTITPRHANARQGSAVEDGHQNWVESLQHVRVARRPL